MNKINKILGIIFPTYDEDYKFASIVESLSIYLAFAFAIVMCIAFIIKSVMLFEISLIIMAASILCVCVGCRFDY